MFDAVKRVEELEAELSEAEKIIRNLTEEAERSRMRSIATVLERDHYKSRSQGVESTETARLIESLQSELHQTREVAQCAVDECEMMRHATINIRTQLCEWRKCCTMFFHVAGKEEDASWAQFTKAAELYHALNDAYGRQHPCDCDD